MADLITYARAIESPAIAAADAALIASLITAASAAIETYCGREFTSTVRTEDYDGDGDKYLLLRAWPLTSVTSITITEDDGTTYSIAAADLTLNEEVGEIRVKSVLTTSDFAYFPSGYQNISVVYTGGYATIPADIQQACVHLIETMLAANQQAGDVTSEKLGDYAVTFAATDKGLPSLVRLLLARYRDVRT